MEKLYRIVCGLRWHGGIRKTWGGYITYDYSGNYWLVYASMYDVCTTDDILVGRYVDDGVIGGKGYQDADRLKAWIESCSIDMVMHCIDE